MNSWAETFDCSVLTKGIYFCIRGTYSAKYSECFGRILAVNIWLPTMQLKTHLLVIYKVQVYYHPLLLPAFSKIADYISSQKLHVGIALITE